MQLAGERQEGVLVAVVDGQERGALLGQADAGAERSPYYITVAPNVGVRIADVGWSPKPRDIVTRAKDGTRYVVTEDKPDGLGWVSLHLKVAA